MKHFIITFTEGSQASALDDIGRINASAAFVLISRQQTLVAMRESALFTISVKDKAFFRKICSHENFFLVPCLVMIILKIMNMCSLFRGW